MNKFIAFLSIFACISLPALAKDVIGLSIPLQGRFSSVSAQLEFGAFLAVDALNSGGRDIELSISDDGCDPTRASDVADRLLADRAKIVVGTLCFDFAEALTNALNANPAEAAIPVIAYDTRNTRLNRLRKVNKLPIHSFSHAPDAEAKAVVEKLLPRFANKPFAIVDDGSIYGRALAEGVRLLGENAGMKAVAVANFRPLQTTQISMLRRLRRSGVEAVFIAGSPQDIITVLKDMKELGLKWPLATGEQAVLLPFEQGRETVPPGLLAVRPGNFRLENAEGLKKKLAVQKIGVEQTLLAGYALVEVAAEAIQQGITNLAGKRFNTVLGPLIFDENGRASPVPFHVFEWDGTTLAPLAEN